MRKNTSLKAGIIIELSKEIARKSQLRDGDWLKVRMLDGKEIVLEKPKQDYWDETFAWGKKFAKSKKITTKDVLGSIRKIRAGK